MTYARLVEKLGDIGISEKEVDVANKQSLGKVFNGVYVVMSTGNRNKDNDIIALAFVVFLGIFSMIGYFQGLAKGQTSNAEIDAQHHHENTADFIETACVGREHSGFLECVNKALQTSGEYQRAEHDLAAQQQMAEFAKWLLVLTMFTTAITGLGVYYVKQTLEQTASTNDAALDAAHAAHESNRLMQESQRPWLKVSLHPADDMFINETQIYQKVDIRIQNVGKTVAESVCVEFEPRPGQMLGSFAPVNDDMIKRARHRTRSGESLVVFPGDDSVMHTAFVFKYRDFASGAVDGAPGGAAYAFPRVDIVVAYRHAGTEAIGLSPYRGSFSEPSNGMSGAIEVREEKIFAESIRIASLAIDIAPS